MVSPIDTKSLQVSSPREKDSTRKAGGDDKAEFSKVLAEEEQSVATGVEDETLIRQEKIKRLKAEVKAGTYLADSKEIAKTLALALEQYI